MFVSHNNQQQDTIFNAITTPLGDELTWRWEARLSALLTEFSWEKKDRILTILRQLFPQEWHRKNIKKAPTIAVIWWPWGHGATYSMRIKILTADYDDVALQQAQASLIKKIFQRIASR